MKVSINWLKELIPFKEDAHTLEALFSTKSQEVESVEKLVDAKGLVTGYVKTCNPHPDADKLSVCQVDIKTEILQIICGAPNVKAGQYVIVAVNGAVLPGNFKIKKTTIRGIESNGMICSLDELGIEHKYHQETGIHEINHEVPLGEDALKILSLDDEILTLDLTPNRADLLSMQGVAYDTGAMLDVPFEIIQPVVKESNLKNPMKISTTTEACLSYYSRVIDDLVIKESPQWMRARLIAAGVRPINNVVDITNYVMLETGQPLHAFDYDLLASDEIIVRLANKNEKFTTLDDKERTLLSEDIVITNGKKAVALGGVMGGAETEVYKETKSILLESAVFNPKNIRLTSSRLDLRSESSTRFERKVNPINTRFALERATELFTKYASGNPRKGIAYFDHSEKTPLMIELSLETINRVLGSNHTVESIKDLLRRLALNYKLKETTFIIEKPSRRQDFENYQDIIEEIGRLAGYDTLPNTLPVTVSLGRLTPYQKFKRTTRTALTNLGLTEVITYSLSNEDTLFDFVRMLNLNPVKLANPMIEHRKSLILTPINGLLEVISYNVARKQHDAHIYEISKRYTKEKETEVLAIAMHGQFQDYGWQPSKPTDFYTLKGIAQALFNRINLLDVRYEKTTINNYHPHQTALIIKEDTVIGHIGKIHPQQASSRDLKDVYVLEIELEAIYKLTQDKIMYESIQKYPSISRDIAIVCKNSLPAQTIIDSIKAIAKARLSNVKIFDVYEGEHVKEDEKSIALRMIFEDKQKTLETKEIDDLVNKIIKTLEKDHQATLR
ncbi:MAG: phenylalanine--tRNA ligase subunit beta [Candidatus Izemoplasmataceae bacterium]